MLWNTKMQSLIENFSGLDKKKDQDMTNSLKALENSINIMKAYLEKNKKFNFIFQEALNWKATCKIILMKTQDNLLDKIESDIFELKNLDKTSRDEIRSFLGPNLFSAHLNYYYGVIVEQAIREVLKNKYAKRENYSLGSESEKLDDKIFKDLYNQNIKELWSEFAKSERLQNKSYYVPTKIYCYEMDCFNYWLSKKRTLRSTPELNGSLISRGLEYLKKIGIKNEIY